MPNFTPRLLLPKPLTSEAYDVNVPNSAMDLVDAAPANVTVCTSSTRPSTPDAGDLIYETDSENLLARISSAWKAANGKAFICTSGTRPASGLTYGGFQIYETDTGNTYIRNAANSAWLYQSGLSLASADRIKWNNDTELFRVGVNAMRTDATLEALQFKEKNGAATNENTQNTSGNVTSTTYVSTLSAGSTCQFTFVAPTSGKIKVHLSIYMFNAGANFNFVSFDIRSGGTIGSGTQIVAPSDVVSVVTQQVQSQTRTFLFPGFTGGSTYNIRMFFRVDGSTGTFLNKQLIVEPVIF